MSKDTTFAISDYEIEIINKYWLLLLKKIAHTINWRADRKKFGIEPPVLSPFDIETCEEFRFKRDERNTVFGLGENKNLELWYQFYKRGFFTLRNPVDPKKRLPPYRLNGAIYAEVFLEAENLFPEIEKTYSLRKERESLLVTKLLNTKPFPFETLQSYLTGSPITLS